VAVTLSNVANERLTQDLEAIFREHYLLVYKTAYTVTGNLQDAEDVLQDLFLWLAQRGIPSNVRSTKAYLYRATVNASLNIVRSRKREVVEELPVEPGSAAHATDVQERLAAAMSQLNPRHVEMLVLRYEHGYSDAEIAKLLGTSRIAVAVALHRARTRLKKLLSVPQKVTHETR
jgi:RNA polymerase sigma-70 factor (ECF subfamily)